MASVLERNIENLLKRRRQEEARKSFQTRLADAITRFTGSMAFVYIHIAYFGLWIVLNLPGVPFPKFDPTYVVLAMCASVEAIFLSTFVLISQNRMAELANRRADLDLQISLLSEHEVTHLIKLVAAIGERMKIDEAHSPDLHELKQDVAPEQVLDRIAESEERASEG